MKILSETGGQTCNQFWQYLYYLKDAILSGSKIYVQLPDKTIEDYPNLLINKYISFPFYSTKLTKFFGLNRSLELTRKCTVLFLNNYMRFIIHNASFKKLNFLSGKPTWGIDVDYTPIIPTIQHLFELRSDLKHPIDKKLSIESDRHKILCGLHMRGGDYRKWKNGKYFFTQHQYRLFAEKFIQINNCKTDDVIFYIASNEAIQHETFEGLNWVTLENATASQDLYALSKCNYIIGTLSSFNAWVSLVWQRPLLTITSMLQLEKLSLNDFGIVLNYTKKDNGWKFPKADDFFKSVNHPWLYRHSNQEYMLNISYD